MKPNPPLTNAEERALFMAERSVSYCNCGAGYVFCVHDRPQCADEVLHIKLSKEKPHDEG